MSDDILAKLRKQNPDLEINFDDDIFNKGLTFLEDECLVITNQTLIQLRVQPTRRSELDATNSELLDTGKMLQFRRITTIHPTQQVLTNSESKTGL